MRSIVFMVFVLFPVFTFGQSANTQLIKESFKKQFPNAQEVEMEQEDGKVEVEFEHNGYDMEAVYNLQGELTETFVEVEGTDLPLVVFQAIADDFAGYELDDVEEQESNGVMVYAVELENDDEEWEAVYDAMGKLMSKQKEQGL